MYDRSLKYKWDNENVLNYAVEEAHKQGLEKGLEQGLQLGLKNGFQQGYEEGYNEICQAIASKLMKQGLSVREIAHLLDITIDDALALTSK